jgi:hypothetical protein
MVLMVIATTIITPIWLKMDYRKDARKDKSDKVGKTENNKDAKVE